MTTASEQVGRNTRQPLLPRPGLRERIHIWLRLDDAPDPTPPLTTAQVLHEEAKAIHGVDPQSQRGEQLYRFLNGLNQSALCLSGGGIRSAAFALGVIQALAAHPRTQNGDPVDAAEDSAPSEVPLSVDRLRGRLCRVLAIGLARARAVRGAVAEPDRPAGRARQRASDDRVAALLQQLSHAAARPPVG